MGLALGLATLAPSANALEFVFRDVSTSGSMTAQQLAGFQTAANYWSSKLTDKVTVYIDIAFNNLDVGILGGAQSNYTGTTYSSMRAALTADATSALDASAVGSLQPGSALSFYATQGDLTTRFDNDNSANNTLLNLTTANAKALGLTTDTGTDTPDAVITFATGFADDFAYTRIGGGVPSNKFDFISVAEHEIGHVLGFTSGVDTVDACAGPSNKCGFPDTPGRFEDVAMYNALDLFRYSAPAKMDVAVGGSPYFSVDGGVSAIESFSTGEAHGDKWQASHFGPGSNALMRAFTRPGESPDATLADLSAFDAIGWDLASPVTVTPVPEPETYAMMLAGLGALGWAARRRRARVPA